MSKAKKIIIIAVAVFVAAVSLTMFFAWSGVLSKDLDNDNTVFRVLQLTDVHLRNSDKDKKVFKAIDMMMEETQPDLIAVTGDVTSERDNESAFKKFAEKIESFKVPWMFNFGNHDAEGKWDKDDITEFLSQQQYCKYVRGTVDADKSGNEYAYGNYYYNVILREGAQKAVLSAEANTIEEADNVITTLFVMDSNMYADESTVPDGYEDTPYDNIHQNQIDWYENSVKEIAAAVNKDESIPVDSLMFFHIPMKEFDAAYENGVKNDGGKFERVFGPVHDDDMFETMVRLGSTKGVFVGHDHMNSYSVTYQGIELSYGYSADHTIYIVPQRGGRVINIKKDGSFTQQGIYRNLGAGAMTIGKSF